MKRLAVLASTALIVALTSLPAEARPHYGYHSHRHHHKVYRHHHYPRHRNIHIASVAGDPRPGAWCAWWVRQQKGISKAYGNLAHGMLRWGHPTSYTTVGAVAVMKRRHVGIVQGTCQLRGGVGVLMISGNTWGRGVRNGVGTACYPVAAFQGFRA